MSETRKGRTGRIAGGIALPSDVRAAFGFANRLRSAFDWVRTLPVGEPLGEATVDTLLTVHETIQTVGDGVKGATDVVKAIVLGRADAGDALYVPDPTTTTLYLGMPTHDKRFSVEWVKGRTSVDHAALLESLVADGLISRTEAAARLARFTVTAPDHRRMRFLTWGEAATV